MAPTANTLNWQVNQLENNIRTVEAIISIVDPQTLTTYRDGGSGWTALEVLCHLRDYEQVFIERYRTAVEQVDGMLPDSTPDKLAAANHYNEQNPAEVIAEWKRRRPLSIAYLRERADSDWERAAIHPVRGKLTLAELLTLETWHDTNHMEQMTRILREKKLSG